MLLIIVHTAQLLWTQTLIQHQRYLIQNIQMMGKSLVIINFTLLLHNIELV